MLERHIQMLMAATGDYAGGIDGAFGPVSTAAMHKVEARHDAAYTFDPTTTTDHRRRTACAQACLNQLGHDAGLVDGWIGNNTTEALNAFLFRVTNGKDEVIDREREQGFTPPANIPRQRDVAQVYGRPGAEIEARLTTIELPFKLKIDWNLRASVNKIRVHRDCAQQLEAALIEVRKHYGEDDMNRLGIDRYAGAYNHRKMRGSNNWSMHAYGCAIDFYAEPNGLRVKCPQALFCSAEYKPFLDIMESHEWLPAIRLWGKDAMHFQRARL
ncbi:M15 family metallopeptidase [Marimonas sp. MJW-29]|uniref:M15 family metallopeptidase n=1 Tax=Sulfitobacter sediminis TaxID=3234186 RepID=A0ABV3RHE0_9RHOB